MRLDDEAIKAIVDAAWKWLYHEDLDGPDARPHLEEELRQLNLTHKPGDPSHSLLTTGR